MLKGISPLISPELLKTLASMGHGDEIVLADANYPGETLNTNVIRADGLRIADLLCAIMPLFELDQYVEYPISMMEAVDGDKLDPKVEDSYLKNITPFYEKPIKLNRIDRFKFYERSKKAFAIVMTGEKAKYGNILLKKGVTHFE
jgi:L-fucose mutarotase